MTEREKLMLKIARQQEKKAKKEKEKREQLAAGFACIKPVSASAGIVNSSAVPKHPKCL